MKGKTKLKIFGVGLGALLLSEATTGVIRDKIYFPIRSFIDSYQQYEFNPEDLKSKIDNCIDYLEKDQIKDISNFYILKEINGSLYMKIKGIDNEYYKMGMVYPLRHRGWNALLWKHIGYAYPDDPSSLNVPIGIYAKILDNINDGGPVYGVKCWAPVKAIKGKGEEIFGENPAYIGKAPLEDRL